MKSNLHKAMILLCIVAFCNFTTAQNEKLFNDIHLYESLESVKQKLLNNVASHSVLTFYEPAFPLAREREEHLLCTNLETMNGILEKVAFTFADNQLHYVEIRGNAINTLVKKRKDTAVTYLNLSIYKKDHLFSDQENDVVRFLSKEASHINLFTWQNPFLEQNRLSSDLYDSSIAIPPFLKMGGELEKLEPLLKENSSFMVTQKLDGSDPNAQLQLNCFGVEYASFIRKIEARFGNGKLTTAWILTGKGEEERIRKKLTAHYGEPVFINNDWEVFQNWTIGLRKDKPEILLLTPELGQFYKKEYFKQ